MLELKNYMETLVWQNVDDVVSGNHNICPCERCRYDIVALALNFLPPRYVVTGKGETWAKVKALEQQFYVDVVAAITNATTLVKTRPHHNRAEEE
ncbi:MAG: late competence development ComFB family protein [Negativicutes bacterium]|nr:late competence development ComFB family protein [Negativicutes bacterium]